MIVQRDELVDLFVLNQWHTQNKTLVLAESGYPNYLNKQAREVLQKDPDLPVFLLHDATRSGMMMAQRVQKLPWIELKEHRVVDVGLSYNDVAKIKRLGRKKNDLTAHVDNIPYMMLASGLGTALVGGLAFADLLEKPEDFGPMDFG